MRQAGWIVALALVTGIPWIADAQWPSFFDVGRARYELDGVRRVGLDSPTSLCDPAALVGYQSRTLRLSTPVRVHPAFVERLRSMEQVILAVAVEVYGRAPTRLIHAGAYNCRAVRGNRARISEHALGNALDVSGFAFPPLPRRSVAPPSDLPRALRRPFAVNLRTHWNGTGEVQGRHALFLRLLVRRLVEQDVFRVIYGPRHPGHGGHFHFDMSPFRWIHV